MINLANYGSLPENSGNDMENHSQAFVTQYDSSLPLFRNRQASIRKIFCTHKKSLIPLNPKSTGLGLAINHTRKVSIFASRFN